MDTVAVLDVGKTNVKLMAVSANGHLLETLARPNPVFQGPPYAHHDLGLVEHWLIDSLRSLAERHSITAFIATGHGSGGVLMGEHGALMPMMDYEQDPPSDIARQYPLIAGSFRERGSPCMFASAHLAKQMLWLEREWPEVFASAKAYLAHPQYWAWRLSGIMASEVTSLAAQSHLWCSLDARLSQLVGDRGWRRLIPPFAPAWQTLGTLRQDIGDATGLSPGVRVLTGIHDSSANLYRYQAAGLQGITVVSTGTWIVPISDCQGPNFEIERPGLCCNADVHGKPLPGMLVMGGREFDAVARDGVGPASPEVLDRLISTGTMALPSFCTDDSLFPGTAGRGMVTGPLSQDEEAKVTLAVLYAALLTNSCLDTLNAPTIILDGSFARDPLYGAIIAGLRQDRLVLVNPEPFGTVAGAALLATHETRTSPARLDLKRAVPIANMHLIGYAHEWRSQSNARSVQ